jgi:homoserine acetyltransferase
MMVGVGLVAGSMFPQEYRGSLFVPEHGSWNRPLEIGYRLVNVMLDDNNVAIKHTVFASGWLQNQNTTAQSVWGKILTPGYQLQRCAVICFQQMGVCRSDGMQISTSISCK